MKLAQWIGETLALSGVRDAFGVVGSGNFRMAAALQARGAAFVAARHETAAVTMADGYATVTGRAGVVTVHQGPGFTNALTGMIEAAKSRSPVLLLAADTPDSWTDSNFRIDQASAATAGGVAVFRASDASTAPRELARAWRSVTVERRASALLIPLDIQDAEAVGPPAAIEPPPSGEASPPPAADIERAAELIAVARRPVIIGGRGAMLAGAREPIEALSASIGAPLATSVVARGLFTGHPWDLGISGGFATPLASELISGADLLLAFGASLNRWTTRHGRLVGDGARIVQVDSDASAFGRHRLVDVGILADAADAARALTATLSERKPSLDPAVERRIAGSRWRDQPFDDRSTGEHVDPRTVTIALDDLLPASRIVVVDGGHFSGWPVMYLGVPDEGGSIFHQAYQSIGLGIGTAIGAAVGRPDRTVVAAVGDGGAFMALGDLETAARLSLPLIVLVYNDDAYGAEVHHFADEGLALDSVRFGPTDLAAIGRAVGAAGITVRRLADLGGLESWLDGPRAGPLVVDLKINASVVGAWLPEAFRA
jgi:thiamine pyrophosphate-dependent acetolactate synthase large subunit-like protein